MRRSLYAVPLVLLLFTCLASATPTCMSNVGYDWYLGLGSGGCVLDDKLFSNFTYSGSSSGGATAMPAAGITVTAFDTALNPGFQFQAGWLVGPGQTQDSLIAFDVTVMPGGSPIVGVNASMGGYLHTADALVGVGETVTGGFTGGVSLYDYSGGTSAASSVWIPGGTWSLHIAKDISVAGHSGIAGVSQVIDRFPEAAVPEPGTFALFGAGFIGIGLVARRRRRS